MTLRGILVAAGPGFEPPASSSRPRRTSPRHGPGGRRTVAGVRQRVVARVRAARRRAQTVTIWRAVRTRDPSVPAQAFAIGSGQPDRSLGLGSGDYLRLGQRKPLLWKKAQRAHEALHLSTS
jgi:hypothetical protein